MQYHTMLLYIHSTVAVTAAVAVNDDDNKYIYADRYTHSQQFMRQQLPQFHIALYVGIQVYSINRVMITSFYMTR